MKKTSLFTIFVLSIFFIQSQTPNRGLSIGYFSGFVTPHNPTMSRMMRPTHGIEITKSWLPSRDSAVLRKFQFPLSGIGLHAFNLGSKEAGSSIAPFVFVDGGLVKINPKITFRLRFATGIGFLSQKFDVYSNRTNRAIGSTANGMMQVLFMFKWKQPKMAYQLGLGLTHYSNGNWNVPNLGINSVGWFATAAFNEPRLKQPKNIIPFDWLKKLEWHFSVRSGRRNLGIDESRNITNYMFEALLNYPGGIAARWRAGVNYFFDRTYIHTAFQPLPKATIKNSSELAVVVGHEYRIGKVGFNTDLGFYLYRPNTTKAFFYEQIGINYYVMQKLSLNCRLKAHFSSADYLQFGLCYGIFSKKKVKPGFTSGWKWVFGGFKME